MRLRTMIGMMVGIAGMMALMAFQQTQQQQTSQSVNPNAPEFKFEHEVWDFGEIPEGPKVKHDFWFTNVGKEPLIIQNVRASCGCTVPIWPKEPIMPGQKGKITVEYNTKGRPGPFTKAITIFSNAKTPTKVIYIKGVVVRQDQATSPDRQDPIGGSQAK